MLHAVEQLDAQVVDDALADVGGEPALHDGEHGVEQSGAHRERRQQPDEAPVALRNGLIDDRAEQQWRQQGQHGIHDDRDEERGDPPAERSHNAPGPQGDLAIERLVLDRGGVGPQEARGMAAHGVQARAVTSRTGGPPPTITAPCADEPLSSR